MTFVSARLLNGFLRSLVLQRIDVDALIGDLPIERSEEARRTALVDWGDVAEIGARLERSLGGPEALEDLGAAITTSRPMPAIRRLAGWTASPITLYRVALRWLELHMPRELATAIESTDDGRLEIRVRMPRGSQSSQPVFHMLGGAARALPCLLDLPEAVVESRVGSHSAIYLVTPPGSGSLLRRAARGLRTLLGSNEAIEDLEGERHLLRRHIDQLERALFESRGREEALRTLVSASDEVLLEVGPDGRILAASDSARYITGYSPEQIADSHLTLWFHRDDDARIRSLLARAFAPDGVGARQSVRARHERGHWIHTSVELRHVVAQSGDPRLVVSLRESTAEPRGERSNAALAARLQSLERRHRDLRDMHTQLLEAERTATSREVADLIEGSLASAIRPLADGLDLAAHARAASQASPIGLDDLAELAQRIDAGLERTLATLRRAKQERSPQSAAGLAESVRCALATRLDGSGARVGIAVADVPGSAWVDADPELLRAAFEHVAEQVASELGPGGELEVDVQTHPEDGVLRLGVRCSRSLGSKPSTIRSIPVDLELARGLLRAQGGDISPPDAATATDGIEITLPLASTREPGIG